MERKEEENEMERETEYGKEGSVLLCSLAVLDPRVGHPMDVLFPTHLGPLSF